MGVGIAIVKKKWIIHFFKRRRYRYRKVKDFHHFPFPLLPLWPPLFSIPFAGEENTFAARVHALAILGGGVDAQWLKACPFFFRGALFYQAFLLFSPPRWELSARYHFCKLWLPPSFCSCLQILAHNCRFAASWGKLCVLLYYGVGINLKAMPNG